MIETPASSPVAERFSAEQAVAAGTDYAELKVGPLGLFWNEFRPQDGACRIWHWRDGQAHCLTPDGFSVRSRVYEYGGGGFCLSDDGLVFVNEADQQLYHQDLLGGQPQPLTHGERHHGDLRWADGQVLAVEETHAPGQVEHRLVALRNGERRVLAEGADFYAAPTLSGDGQRLAWIEWSRPEQPWTITRLMCSARGVDGQWQTADCVAGEAESLQQPCFDAQGRLYCLSDRNGFWQPWGETPEGWAALPALAADHASAPWQLGASSWLALGENSYLASWFEGGFSRLGVQRADGSLDEFSGAYTRFRSLDQDGQFIYAIAASASSPAAVIAIDRSSHAVQVLAGGVLPLPSEQISQPRSISYRSGDGVAHGFFYPAMDGSSTPPLVVFVHGGPTSACHPVLDTRIQYWTQRGFAVADLNYRGSTSYGRAYRQALHLRWGEVDVEDACAAVSYLAGEGLINPQQAFIRGGSAGGYTTLCALAFRDVFRGGASLYGVSDPLALTRDTHKFEGDYLDWLIGDPQVDIERYRARTPLLYAGQIKVPVIFFQGELDAVVVPAQTRTMLEALLANGIAAQGHFYANERHGFRTAANLAHALEEEWKFYCEILGKC
ncbi:S9 family peptidase [Pseudomonas fontis]|uniref:Prolyl oligopeptidase family serine peptidase n=1 Tax=Pseudomonas fontis TaxID=2942633 RepID=A0ABT5NRD2_9PSED|nr:prolyl oligopeptidase family serine peptidase [Pseudomonas fontis]MDD0973380.1 prolyl oligopeptidase family serine peptidase [Pseudomonas fontis]MDD0990733.1 prolyl oligopeptidase family serine peptidase [Pseudomonas fontis]